MNSGTDFENAVKFLNGSRGPSSEDSVPQRVFKAGSGPRKRVLQWLVMTGTVSAISAEGIA